MRAPYRFHDFRKGRPLSEEQVLALETIHRKFARAAGEGLATLLRTAVEVKLIGLDQRSYADFTGSRSHPTCLHLVYCLPCGRPFLLEMNPSFLFPMIERLLGGSGRGRFQPVRPFTRIEQGVVSGVAERLLEILGKTWSSTDDLRFDVAEYEHNPLLMQIVGPAEPSVILGFQLSFAQVSGRIHICLPVAPFEAVLEKLTRPPARRGSREANSSGERKAILNRIDSTEVTLAAELEGLPIALNDILALKPGDVIDTQLQTDSQVNVLVEGKSVFRGRCDVQEGRRTVSLLSHEMA